MANNKYMKKDRIAILFVRKTYYECCEMCVTKLGEHVSARVTVDSLTEESVAKFTALIAVAPDRAKFSLPLEEYFIKQYIR